MLHDTIEDTSETYQNIKTLFGDKVANGVKALTKNEEIQGKQEKMKDSLNRIKLQPREIWAVKMADRICNLYAPPFYWSNEKKLAYQKEAELILEELKEGSQFLAGRLNQKIKDYSKYID